MKGSSALLRCCAIPAAAFLLFPAAFAQRQIPNALKDWQDWATWDVPARGCPTPFHDAARPVCFWPGALKLEAGRQSAAWELEVTVFSQTWVPLPGDDEMWPLEVRVGSAPLAGERQMPGATAQRSDPDPVRANVPQSQTAAAVVAHAGRPSVWLEPGVHRVTGVLRWEEMPQHLRVPSEIGLLTLFLDGQKVELPAWDAEGNLWLRRARVEATDRDAISAKVWRVIEDGIPVWLRTEIELSVSGRSREEILGHILPEGWSVAAVAGPLPVALDEQGLLKAQVRAGKWLLHVDAFRTSDPREIRFAAGTRPVAAAELIGFRAAPEMRLATIEGLLPVDVSQTTFPEKWRGLPVYQWPTDQPFRLVEKMRGMGLQKPAGLTISREFWLDEDGRGLTFRDRISGALQQVWRLDVAAGQQLGAAKVGGQPQLITTNPVNGAPGVEIRVRNLDLWAIGRSDRTREIAATGWRTAADRLEARINLPPGWRLFAVLGPDWVRGDWLTAWTLLDLFLLLIFSLAVFRLLGWKAGLVAFLAFGLAYHEPGAPRLAWLFLLVPLALRRVVPAGGLRNWIEAWRYLAAALLLLGLVPFLGRQIQGFLYPQLEPQGVHYGARPPADLPLLPISAPAAGEQSVASSRLEETARALPRAEGHADKALRTYGVFGGSKNVAQKPETSNLAYEAKAKIQTGPAEPQWRWNVVTCGWNGPVAADETIRPVFISLTLHRVLTAARVVLLVLLGGLLLRARDRAPIFRNSGAGVAAAAVLLALCGPAPACGQLPDAATLETLRQRLLEPPDAYPRAAEIARVDLKLGGDRLAMLAEVHAALRVAVPLPGRLPLWSPVSVTVDDLPHSVLRRDDGHLWVVVPAGVHRVSVEGLLAGASEWEWTFVLKPRRVTIDAPGWTVTGVRPGGIPEDQVFFARQRKAAAGEAGYDRRDFHAIVVLDRHLEAGLVWQLRNVVKRLSPPGKAVSLKIPLLAGEKVLTPQVTVENGCAEVRLGTGETELAWESELPAGGNVTWTAARTERWVERWHLVSSPVWNVAFAGLAPVFESNQSDLVPVWHPWPGESVALRFSKPAAVSGDTVTVQRASHTITLGARQRTNELVLQLESSLGDEFPIELGPDADVATLEHDGRAVPVRRDGSRLLAALHPGSQTLRLEWRTNEPLQTRVTTAPVKLPVEAANITTVMHMPESRWVLMTAGPLRGPAVRFWTVLAVSAVAAWVLGGLALSPLRRFEWVLLALGLTQVHSAAALIVVGWLFLLAWRGRHSDAGARWQFNLLQIVLGILTFVALGILVMAVRKGLLGSPEMFIRGNGSTRTMLQWFQPRSGQVLPAPHVISVSVWFYRLLMLAWALWLAASLIRWLKWAWTQWNEGGCWRRRSPAPKTPPPIPAPDAGK